MELGYSPKNLKFDDEARDKLKSGVEKIARAVKSTLGPSGNTVLIESPEHTHGITVTKDGITVAKSVSLMDPVENLAVRIIREAADRTGTEAGDGTTTSIVLAEALINAGFRHITKKHNKTEVLRQLAALAEDVITELGAVSKLVDDNNLEDVAIISANNDETIGALIADTYKQVGRKGVVVADNSLTGETYAVTTKGIKVDRGYSSNLFVNNFERDESIHEKVSILVSDTEIINVMSIEKILAPHIRDGKSLLIIAPMTNNTLNILAANARKNDSVKVCVVQPPDFGYRKEELMQDIAFSVGATYFSEKTGDDLSLIEMSDLGYADRVVVGRDSSVIIQGDGDLPQTVTDRIDQLEVARSNADKKADRDFITKRIASLSGGIGVIHVGGNTDLERKELFDRVDDAICAVRSALEEGIVEGGGRALYSLAYDGDVPDAINTIAAVDILSDALTAPLEQIFENAGLDVNEVYSEDVDQTLGYDVKNKVFGDMFEMGIIDPLKVTKLALRNAVSVAVTILSTNCVISQARTYEDG